jgi:hypothetical protein
VGNPRAGDRDDAVSLVNGVINEASDLMDRVTRAVFLSSELDGLLGYAADLQRVAGANPFGAAARTAWSRLRADINDLTEAYSVDWDWQNPRSTASGGRSTSARLSGTYRLSASDSDDPRSAADRVLANVSSAERTRILRQIENRLTPPDVIAIDRVGSRSAGRWRPCGSARGSAAIVPASRGSAAPPVGSRRRLPRRRQGRAH